MVTSYIKGAARYIFTHICIPANSCLVAIPQLGSFDKV